MKRLCGYGFQVAARTWAGVCRRSSWGRWPNEGLWWIRRHRSLARRFAGKDECRCFTKWIIPMQVYRQAARKGEDARHIRARPSSRATCATVVFTSFLLARFMALK
jgi:hypothetical protein